MMVITGIIKKEILHNIRSRKTIILRIAFPLLLILLLGAVFNNQFEAFSLRSGDILVYFADITGGIEKGYRQASSAGMNEGSLSDIADLSGIAAVGAKSYFGVSMLSLFIMYSINFGLSGVKNEQHSGAASRILSAPVDSRLFYLAKLAGMIITSLFMVLIVMAVGRIFMGVQWGARPVLLTGLLLTQVIMCCSMGTALGLVIKDENKADSILNIIIPVIAFLGGNYYPLEMIGNDLLMKIAVISPMHWQNKALLSLLQGGGAEDISTAVLLNIGTAAAFIIPAISIAARREVR